MTEEPVDDATEEYRPTLGETSHTNPYTDEVFGETQTYGRGRVVAADGGREADGEPEAGPDGETLQDVDHTPPGDGDGAAPVYERGHEGKEDVR
ncbi:MAG: hypothetical protein V5A62_09935 [Haloarculaceae archaeon]